MKAIENMMETNSSETHSCELKFKIQSREEHDPFASHPLRHTFPLVKYDDSDANQNRSNSFAECQTLVGIGTVVIIISELLPAIQVSRDNKHNACPHTLEKSGPHGSQNALNGEERP